MLSPTARTCVLLHLKLRRDYLPVLARMSIYLTIAVCINDNAHASMVYKGMQVVSYGQAMILVMFGGQL